MNSDLRRKALTELVKYCEAEQFKGWDPYDGLNSKTFAASRLGFLPVARLAWIQFFKRSPWNFRGILGVPKGYNPKGIGLFLSGFSKELKAQKAGRPSEIRNLEEKISRLADELLSLKSSGFSGACWGYNFDWQARGGLFFESGTPTVVATTYAAFGLFDAYEATGEERYLKVALDSVNFVIHDLNRSYRPDGTFLFSYSIKHGNNTVYNASLLGSKLLARAYHYTKDDNLIALAKGSVMAVVNSQEADGSWVYGELDLQSWKDSFHTGFNLECLAEYMRYSGDYSVGHSVEIGLKYYLEHFFTIEGVSKYYHDKTYPIDIHSPAQLVVTLASLNEFQSNRELVERVMLWTVRTMQSKDGYFAYQKRKYFVNWIPYMRWSQAWMLHSLIVYNIAFDEMSGSND